jgi:hypothetical protein
MLRLEGVEIDVDGWRLSADLALEAGTATAVIGPSGAGKSTLLAAVAGFLDPVAGRILWNGRDLTPLAPAQRPVTLLFQEHNLFAHLSAAQNVGLGLRPDLRLDRAAWARVEAALAAVGLGGLGRRRPAELSGASGSGRRWRARCCATSRCSCSTSLRGARAGAAGGDARPRGAHPRRAGGDAGDGDAPARRRAAGSRRAPCWSREGGRIRRWDGRAVGRASAGAGGVSGARLERCPTDLHRVLSLTKVEIW